MAGPSLPERDPVLQFRRLLDSHLTSDAIVLDVGAGVVRNAYDVRGRVQRIVGVNALPGMVDNPLLDEGIVVDGEHLPFNDAIFDLSVLLHLRAGARRGPGAVPERGRAGLESERPLPLAHAQPRQLRLARVVMNARRTLHRLFERTGLEVERMSMIEVQPNYLTFSTPTFLLGAAWGRAVNATDLLAGWRVNIMCVVRKPGAAPVAPSVEQASSEAGK